MTTEQRPVASVLVVDDNPDIISMPVRTRRFAAEEQSRKRTELSEWTCRECRQPAWPGPVEIAPRVGGSEASSVGPATGLGHGVPKLVDSRLMRHAAI